MSLPKAALALSLLMTPLAARAADLPPEPAMLAGFERVVFNAEIAGRFSDASYVKKFTRPVRFRVEQGAAIDRQGAVASFVARLGREIPGLDAAMAGPGERANFIVHIVDEKDYQTAGHKLYRNPFMQVPGNCIVRASYGRHGIEHSSAIIVSDRGERLFQRCLVEELLQGLGPLDDNPDAPQSVFNDRSTHTGLTRYDKIILGMLYDERLKAGTSLERARPLLPALLRDARQKVR